MGSHPKIRQAIQRHVASAAGRLDEWRRDPPVAGRRENENDGNDRKNTSHQTTSRWSRQLRAVFPLCPVKDLFLALQFDRQWPAAKTNVPASGRRPAPPGGESAFFVSRFFFGLALR